jgi:phosphatidylethanolamine-binding protein (PEBP) family uncharacterized protein
MRVWLKLCAKCTLGPRTLWINMAKFFELATSLKIRRVSMNLHQPNSPSRDAMPNQTKHDFRGITTTSKVEPARMPERTEVWSVSANKRTHTLIPTSKEALFMLVVEVNSFGHCHLVISLKDKDAPLFKLETHFAVDDVPTTSAEVNEFQRKAKKQAQNLLKRQAALL